MLPSKAKLWIQILNGGLLQPGLGNHTEYQSSISHFGFLTQMTKSDLVILAVKHVPHDLSYWLSRTHQPSKLMTSKLGKKHAKQQPIKCTSCFRCGERTQRRSITDDSPDSKNYCYHEHWRFEDDIWKAVGTWQWWLLQMSINLHWYTHDYVYTYTYTKIHTLMGHIQLWI